jgi:hypothetical protein
MHRKTSRRAFVIAASAGAFVHFLLPRRAAAARLAWITAANGRGSLVAHATDHPTPRPGITADAVLTKAQLADTVDAIPTFDLVREIPQIVDGIRCNCGCASETGYYSLLSCFEAPGMAKHCAICQGQARLAHRMNKAGKTLDEVRKGIDARYG